MLSQPWDSIWLTYVDDCIHKDYYAELNNNMEWPYLHERLMLCLKENDIIMIIRPETAQYNPIMHQITYCALIASQQTQNIYIAFVQRRPSVFDVGPTLYKCYTNVLCLQRKNNM